MQTRVTCNQHWLRTCCQFDTLTFYKDLHRVRHMHRLLDQVYRCRFIFFPGFHIPCITPHLISPTHTGNLDDIDPSRTQQNHWHDDSALTQRHITDEGIPFFQLPVKEGDDGLLSLKLVGPVKAKLEHSLDSLRESKFAFFIKKGSFINDFHENFFCSNRRRSQNLAVRKQAPVPIHLDLPPRVSR